MMIFTFLICTCCTAWRPGSKFPPHLSCPCSRDVAPRGAWCGGGDRSGSQCRVHKDQCVPCPRSYPSCRMVEHDSHWRWSRRNVVIISSHIDQQQILCLLIFLHAGSSYRLMVAFLMGEMITCTVTLSGFKINWNDHKRIFKLVLFDAYTQNWIALAVSWN